MGNYYPKLRHIATGGGALSMGLVGYANVDKLIKGGLEWTEQRRGLWRWHCLGRWQRRWQWRGRRQRH
jgi:hypothetical protein